jgi:hypothetical protein
MSDFLNSMKADLSSRRMLPILVIVGLALIAAVAYAVMGGGGSSPSTSASAVTPVPAATSVSGILVSPAPTSAEKPIAETTSGTVHRGGTPPRNPFQPLPSKTAKTASSSPATGGGTTTPASGAAGGSGSSSSSSESGSGSGSSSAPSGGSSTTPAKKSQKPAAPKTVYKVAVGFGTAPAGTPPAEAKLTAFTDLKRQQPLPDAKQPLVVFRGVIAGGGSATFTLVGEAILRGPAACVPNASQCLSIDLKVGQSEELEYIPLGGAAVVYQLQVVSITSTTTTASAARAFAGESKAGLQFLHHAGLAALPGLRYSDAKGVLVFPGHGAFAARAHSAVRHEHHKH